MEPLRFRATLEDAAGGGIKIPHDVRALFGRAKPPVLVTVRAGQCHTYRSTVAVYSGEYFVPLNKANARAAGIVAGEPFEVTVETDDEPRVIEPPDELAAALDDHGLRERWDRLSYTHQREYAEAINEARNPQTRERRIRRTVERLRD